MKKLFSISRIIFIIISSFLFYHSTLISGAAAAGGGSWQVVQKSIGVSAMHMQLLHNDRVVLFDRTDFGRSNLLLPAGKCRRDAADRALKVDCTAHSAEYDVATNTFRPLTVQTDVWCSSGAVMDDGTLVQTGGFNDGERKVRLFKPCSLARDDHGCDWEEVGLGLAASRWYATNHVLPGGGQIVIGGTRQFNYEFYPKGKDKRGLYDLPFLAETNDKGIQNNLYPFVFLCPDGTLFVFANNRAILLDYTKNRVVKEYPTIPGGDPRSYPSAGSAVLLPLKSVDSVNEVEAEVLVCGGAPRGAYKEAKRGRFVGALRSCGRVRISDPRPEWEMEVMPRARVMGDMVVLPNGKVLIINGAGAGVAGWELARDPVYDPVLYDPDRRTGSRFQVEKPGKVPRMYHSSAVLLRDGRVLVGGSNPHFGYDFEDVLFPTELSLEAFSPDYLDPGFGYLRPEILLPFSQAKFKYAQRVTVKFSVEGKLEAGFVKTTLVSPSFATHSFSMNQRLLELPIGEVKYLDQKTYQVEVTMPGSANLAPPGYFLMFVVHNDVPSSKGIWVHIGY